MPENINEIITYFLKALVEILKVLGMEDLATQIEEKMADDAE